MLAGAGAVAADTTLATTAGIIAAGATAGGLTAAGGYMLASAIPGNTGDSGDSDPTCPESNSSDPVYENPGHHDPLGGPNPYNPNKAVLPTDAEAQFANSTEINGVRWTKVGSGRNAVYYRYFDTGNDTWHFSGSSNGVTQSGADVRIPLNRIPIEIRRLP